jgi:hypothetical protein
MTEVIDMGATLLKHTQPVFHFLLVNPLEWRTGTDLHALMKDFDKRGYTYWIWYVPCEESAHYEINFYQPQVEGSFVLMEHNPAEKKRKAKR